jgi:hypothetical protein
LLHTGYEDRSSDLGVRGAVEKKTSSKIVHIVTDVLMFFLLLVLLVSPVIISVIRGGGGGFPEWSLYRNIHMLAGWAISALMVVHIIINYRQILAVINFSVLPTVSKIQYIVMFLMLISMIITVVTGAIWGNLGLGTSQMVRSLHSLSSWLAFLFTGIHIGFNISKFMSYIPSSKRMQ